MLNAHDWDNCKINPNKSKQNNNDKKKSDTKTSNKTEAMTDESTIMSGLTFAQMKGSCYCCRVRGHLSSRCPEKKQKQSEWAANKMKEVIHALQILNQAAADNETVGSAQPSQSVPTRGNNDGIFSWSNFQKEYEMAKKAEDNMKDVILLNNQSTVDLLL